MQAAEVKSLLEEKLPNTQVEVEGEGCNFQLNLISDDLAALSPVKRQQQIYAHLYLNGLYWGMYHIFERFEDDMLAANFGGQGEDWDAIKDAGSASVLEVVDGDQEMDAVTGDLERVLGS